MPQYPMSTAGGGPCPDAKYARRYDCLIVGLGLAGGLLAWQLRQRGWKILLVDPCLGRSASRTAAGLINPVTGKRLVKTADFENLYAAAKRLYGALETLSGRVFLRPMALLRLFASEEQAALWRDRTARAGHDPDFGEYVPPHGCPRESLAPHGGALVRSAATLDTVALLDWLVELFGAEGALTAASVHPGELAITPGEVRWNGIRAGRVVFCQGFRGALTPWFDWLPFQPAKGEILTLSSERALTPLALAKQKWLIPVSGGYRLGATYQRGPFDEEPTEAGRRELLDALSRELLAHAAPFEVLEHKAGVRPGTRDKHPFLGFHPRHRRVAVFNGFGSKGALTIPFYSDAFADCLVRGAQIPAHADISRHYDAHFLDR